MVQRWREGDEGGVGVRGQGRRRELVFCDLEKAGGQAQETFQVEGGGTGGCSCFRNVSCNEERRAAFYSHLKAIYAKYK